MKKTIFAGIALIFATSVHAQQTQNGPTVHISSGVLRGQTEGEVSSFKGIPYAAPPIGEFRWRPPQPVKSWQGERDATKFGADPAQMVGRETAHPYRRILLKTVYISMFGFPQMRRKVPNCRSWFGYTAADSLPGAVRSPITPV